MQIVNFYIEANHYIIIIITFWVEEFITLSMFPFALMTTCMFSLNGIHTFTPNLMIKVVLK